MLTCSHSSADWLLSDVLPSLSLWPETLQTCTITSLWHQNSEHTCRNLKHCDPSSLLSTAHRYDFLTPSKTYRQQTPPYFEFCLKFSEDFSWFGPLDRWRFIHCEQHAHSCKGFGAADEHKKHTDSGAAEKFSLLLREFRGLLNQSQSLKDTQAGQILVDSQDWTESSWSFQLEMMIVVSFWSPDLSGVDL